VLTDLADAVTHLGDYRVVIALAIAYGTLIRHDARPLLAVLIAISAATFFKSAFAMPRPPGAGIGGFGFPSGHATVGVACYGAIALVEDRGLGNRVRIAAVIAVIIATTRVLIGVHYLHDVVAGLALGVAVLGGTFVAADAVRNVVGAAREVVPRV